MALDFVDPFDENAVRSLCDNIRYLLSLTITEEEVPNDLILKDHYFGASSREIELRLDIADQSQYEQYSDEEKEHILTALEYRITSKLIGDLRKILSKEKLENSLRYHEWDVEEMKLIYLRLIEKELWVFRDLTFKDVPEPSEHLPKDYQEKEEEEMPRFVNIL